MSWNYEWELLSENYDKERIMTQYITLHGTLHGKVEIYRDTGVSKNCKHYAYVTFITDLKLNMWYKQISSC